MLISLCLTMLAAGCLYFLYPVVLGYCSVAVSGPYLPGVLAALCVIPLAVAYGYAIPNNRHRLLFTLVAVVPLLYLLTGLPSNSSLLDRSAFDVLIAAGSFAISASITSIRRRKIGAAR
jgi:hypothetical protein